MRLSVSHNTVNNPRALQGISVILIILAALGGAFISVVPLSLSLAICIALFLCVGLLVEPLTAFALLLILSPLRALVLTEAPASMPVDLGLLLTAVVIAVWLTHRISKNGPILTRFDIRLMMPLLVLIIANAISGFAAVSVSAWLVEMVKWLIIALLGYLVYEQVHESFRWQWLICMLCAAAVANAIVGVYIFLGGSGALHLLVNNRYFRSFGTFGQPNPFGGFMGLVAPLACVMSYGYLRLVWRQWRWYRQFDHSTVRWVVFYLTCAVMITVGVFISWSRGAWLGFGTSLIVMLVAIPKHWWQRIAIIALLSVTIFFVWNSGWLPATITSRIGSATSELFQLDDVRAVDITSDNYPIVERLAHWQAALNMAEYNFWFGVGSGNYEVAYPEYRLINWKEPLGHAHNFYLNVMAETGIIGLFAFLYFMFSLLRISWRARIHPDLITSAAATGFVGTWTYLLVHSLTDNLFVNNLFLHIGVMIGIVMALGQSVHSTKVLPV